ncbi:MAG: helicase-related protein [Rhodobacterales bacterium]
MSKTPSVIAVLGPTNTGKTFYAIDRMLSYKSGIIGLPLRLLAREVYDKIVHLRGKEVVALVTGEERILPLKPKYWVCTVEAMPTQLEVEFVAVDEIQLCTDAERGYIFTERLLNSRGFFETLFMGSDTMRSIIKSIVPEAQFVKRERFSTLTHTGSKKLNRLQPRSAVIGFSAEKVYSIAELIRSYKGGCAVVLGALSPRTRNSQVEMYQNGDVGFLVATDAIGMGLNLDVSHISFSGLTKFDGRRVRRLAPNELAQIAGRAGRYMKSGTFGTTGDSDTLEDHVVEAIQESRFPSITKLQWRNNKLEFNSIQDLVGSLELQTNNQWLSRTRQTIDLTSLKLLNEVPNIEQQLKGVSDVKLLWEICRLPDFRDITIEEHIKLLQQIFEFRREGGLIPSNWLHKQISRIDRTDGDIDALSRRLAFIRTWTYVSECKNWVDEENYWRERTREVEDHLSDALHESLTKRFVDRRTSILLKKLKGKETILAKVSEFGEVTIDGEVIGSLDGFRFKQDKSSSSEESKALRQAAVVALEPHITLRAEKLYNAPDLELDITTQGKITWGDMIVGKLVRGSEILNPVVDAFVDQEITVDLKNKILRRLQHFVDRKIAASFEKLISMSKDDGLVGTAKGFAFRLVENLGVISRDSVQNEVKALEQDQRANLRKHGVRFGQFTIFMPILLKPASTQLKLILSSLFGGLNEFPQAPTPGLVTIPSVLNPVVDYYSNAGYRLCGDRAIRIDMLERLADLLRERDSRRGFEAQPEMLSITGTSLEQFANLMAGLGYNVEKGQRNKITDTILAVESNDKENIDDISLSSKVVEQEIEKKLESDDVLLEVFYTFKWINEKVDIKKRYSKIKKEIQKKTGVDTKVNKPVNKKIGKTHLKEEKKIDPDNPFAVALKGLKERR